MKTQLGDQEGLGGKISDDDKTILGPRDREGDH
jgi:hypothetical protein